jgi:hypothetical protein
MKKIILSKQGEISSRHEVQAKMGKKSDFFLNLGVAVFCWFCGPGANSTTTTWTIMQREGY